MTSPLSYFQERISSNEQALSSLKRKAFILSMLRLLVFLSMILGVYLFWGNTAVIAGILVIGLGGFLFLVSRYTDVKKKRDYHQRIKDLNEAEIKGLNGDHSSFSSGEEYLSAEHYYNQDIDLFGVGTIYPRIVRAGTKSGKNKLAELLNSNDCANIPQKQSAIQELSTLSDWRQSFFVHAGMIEQEVEKERVIDWMKTHQASISTHFKWISLVYLFLSLGVMVVFGLGIIPGEWVLANLFLGLGITSFSLKKINKLYRDAGEMKETFSQYAKLIRMLEEQSFEDDLLKAFKQKLQTTGEQASETLKRLSAYMNNLDQRNNLLFGFIANGFILWDLRYCALIEEWITESETSVNDWFEAIATIEAYNSFANFAFIHSEYSYPILSNDQLLKADRLGHPLLDPEKRVNNHVAIKKGEFFIITGANMAGKSTFLRTISLSIVMANCGLPVCAKSFEYSPIKLISSMRTSDSLLDDASYFFSELKRLKYIVEEIQNDRYFIILDEILKGTNSKDKAEGSKQFVKKLVGSGSTGLIATHDLSLCVLSEELKAVQNHYFDAQIVNDELYFDYTFKEGICQNMNASFLLKKMGIV